jgi:hypothetical protein
MAVVYTNDPVEGWDWRLDLYDQPGGGSLTSDEGFALGGHDLDIENELAAKVRAALDSEAARRAMARTEGMLPAKFQDVAVGAHVTAFHLDQGTASWIEGEVVASEPDTSRPVGVTAGGRELTRWRLTIRTDNGLRSTSGVVDTVEEERHPVIAWVRRDTPDRLYVVTVTGGIHPEVHGPFSNEDERQAEAERLHAAQDPETDAVFLAAVNADRELSVDYGSFESR